MKQMHMRDFMKIVKQHLLDRRSDLAKKNNEECNDCKIVFDTFYEMFNDADFSFMYIDCLKQFASCVVAACDDLEHTDYTDVVTRMF